MTKKRFWLGLVLVIVSVVFPFYGESQSSNRVTSAVSQTVVTIQRHARDNDKKKDMKIYIDGYLIQTQGRRPKPIVVENGGVTSIAVNNGVHTIYVEVDKKRSDTLNFTANGEAVAFVAAVEGGIRGAVQDALDAMYYENETQVNSLKTRVVLRRNIIQDDTGSLVDRATQETF